MISNGMAQLVVRHLEEDVKARLKRRAASHARSLEDEVRHILRQAVSTDTPRVTRLGSRITGRFRGIGLDADLPEWRGEAPTRATFVK